MLMTTGSCNNLFYTKPLAYAWQAEKKKALTIKKETYQSLMVRMRVSEPIYASALEDKMKNTQKNQNSPPLNIFPPNDDFLRIFLPMIDDEEQRRLEGLEQEQEDWNFLSDETQDDDSDDFEEDF